MTRAVPGMYWKSGRRRSPLVAEGKQNKRAVETLAVACLQTTMLTGTDDGRLILKVPGCARSMSSSNACDEEYAKTAKPFSYLL
jgi:hypothetical protein